MRLSKISLAVSAIFGLSVAPAVFAIDLYMDAKTEQLYAKPGPGRVQSSNFVKEGPAPKTGPGRYPPVQQLKQITLWKKQPK